MKFLITTLSVTIWLFAIATADELYVRNHHVPQVRMIEGRRFVALRPFVEALGLELSTSGHGWLVGDKPDEMPALKPGEVWLAGTLLKSRFVGGEVSISLGEAAQALGATLVPNSALNTTDFRLPR